MREKAMVILIIVLVIASCLIAGCSSLPFLNSGTQPAPQPTPGKINVGLAVGSGSGAPETARRLQFENTTEQLLATPFVESISESSENVSFEKQFKSIRGMDLDENGNASSWTFMVEHDGKTTIIMYGPQGITQMDGAGTTNQTEIVLSQIISPRDLFIKNHDLILNTTGARDLTLNSNYYIITIMNNGTRTDLVFDATTGGLKS